MLAFRGGGALDSQDAISVSSNQNLSLDIDTNIKKKVKLSGTKMFTIVFSLIIFILGVTAGLTYSGFQSTAQSSGTLTFAVNGHSGTLNLTGTKVTAYDSQDLILTFTIASETGYNSLTINNITITMGGNTLSKSGNDFKNGNIIVANYNAGTLTINRANVTSNLAITGSSTPITYTIAYNANGGTGTMANTIVTYDDEWIDLRPNAFTRAGYTFAGWADWGDGIVLYGDRAYLSGQNLYNDFNTTTITLYAVWKAQFGNPDLSWSEIRRIAEYGKEKADGSGLYGFKVGDTRAIEIKDTSTDSCGKYYTIRIADIRDTGYDMVEGWYNGIEEDVRYWRYDSYYAVPRNANIVFELVEILQYTALDSTGNATSWTQCTTMRNALNGSANTSVKNRLPTDLSSVLVAWSTTNDCVQYNHDDDLDGDYLFLPTCDEIFDEYQFDYYSGCSPADSIFIKTDKINGYGANNAGEWWLRSFCDDDSYFDSVDYDAYFIYGLSNNAAGVSFCFAF